VNKPITVSSDFRVGEFAIYPSHGLGVVHGVEPHASGDQQTEQLVIKFQDTGMTLRLPIAKIKATGLRRLSSREAMERALAILVAPATGTKPVWPREIKRYEAKLNSGDPLQIAEVVRDLQGASSSAVRNDKSQRIFFERGLERLAQELAAIEGTPPQKASEKISQLIGSPDAT